jgi:hypothetical protein
VQHGGPGFDGAETELEALLLAGMNSSSEIPEDEFWISVDYSTDAMLADRLR